VLDERDAWALPARRELDPTRHWSSAAQDAGPNSSVPCGKLGRWLIPRRREISQHLAKQPMNVNFSALGACL